METPTFDAHGYPTKETLDAIEHWPWKDVNALLDFVKAAWHWPEHASHDLDAAEASVLRADPPDKFLRLATGGWSGNESLIAAFRRNHITHGYAWRLSTRGGLHIYEYHP